MRPMKTLWPIAALWAGFAQAQTPEPPMRVRTLIVVDDPDGGVMTRKLSQSAALLYGGLSNPKDEVALVVGGDKASLVPLVRAADPETFRRVRETLGKAGEGKAAPLAQVPRIAAEVFSTPAAGAKNAVVIFAHAPREGQPASPAGPAGAFAKLGIPVYVVAFGNRVDPSRYRPVVDPTGGELFVIRKGEQLEQAFSSIRAQLRDKEAIPVVGDRLVLDDSIGAATVVMAKRGPRDVNRLVTPGDRVLGAKTKHPGVAWSSFAEYDLVRIESPEAGTWQVRQPPGAPPAASHIEESELRLQVRVGPREPVLGDRAIIEASLERGGKTVSSYAEVKHLVLEAEVIDPSGRLRPVRLNREGDGRFRAELDNEMQGYHQVRLTAFSPEVQRERRLSFLVHPACFLGRFDRAEGRLDIALSPSCPRFAELFARALVFEGDELQGEVPFSREGNGLVAMPPRPALSKEHRLEIRIEAKTHDGHRIESGAGGPFRDVAREATAWDAIVAVLERLLILNVPVVVGVVGLVAVRGSRRPRRAGWAKLAEENE